MANSSMPQQQAADKPQQTDNQQAAAWAILQSMVAEGARDRQLAAVARVMVQR